MNKGKNVNKGKIKIGDRVTSIIAIKAGDKQPLDCPKCKDKLGYRTSVAIRTHYHTFYDKNGNQLGGEYSDWQPIVHSPRATVCHNCGGKLLFRIDVP